MKIRRVGAYGVSRDPNGWILLARNSDASEFPGLWTLPGGGVEQGEHPDDALIREFAEETGLEVRIATLRDVTADVEVLPNGNQEHTDRLVYDVTPVGGSLRAEVGGTTDRVEWVSPAAVAELPLMPFTARVLELPVAALPPYRIAGDGAPVTPRSVQRFSAYAAATEPAGRILLTRIAPGYPGAGLWHAPGGGTDHGETPVQALHRELAEETSQHGRVIRLLGVSHRYDPAAVGPEATPIDWHVIRVLFRVVIDAPSEPTVSEAAGGSTDAAAWFSLREAGELELTELARGALMGISTETSG